MTYEQWKVFMERYRKELAALPVSAWAKEELAAAAEAGITDGARPQSFATRQEVAVMVGRLGKLD